MLDSPHTPEREVRKSVSESSYKIQNDFARRRRGAREQSQWDKRGEEGEGEEKMEGHYQQ